MKNKIVLLGLLVIAIVLVSGCTQSNSLTITSPTEGQEVAGPDVTIKLSTNLKVVAPSDKNVQGEGHFHLYVDGGTYIPVSTNSYTIKGLSAGEHTVKVELHANDHSLLGIEKTVKFKVKATAVPLSQAAKGTSLLDTISGEGNKPVPTNVEAPPSLPTGKFIGK
ncbi:MAG: Ig-like domain-containing protein [Candidatus Aenigmarchaeota archaeon]|nr:Ig-like domain-containing protein [Candidatus Aenigmarchaeota archaeon]